MASLIYLDTHVVAWLYASGSAALSEAATGCIHRANDIRISPMARLELQYLFEIGRVTEPAAVVVDALTSNLGMTVCDASFAQVVHLAEQYERTRDPFDRLIVAHAAMQSAPLVTKDGTLHATYSDAVW